MAINRFARQKKAGNALLKELFFSNGKFNRSAIMKEAWARARRIASNIPNSKASEFISESLKYCWSIARGI